jgi:hypothetical protein
MNRIGNIEHRTLNFELRMKARRATRSMFGVRRSAFDVPMVSTGGRA